MAKKIYILLSIKHTKKEDEFITMWRPNSRGYTRFIEPAGRYDFLEDEYHGTETNIPVEAKLVENLGVHVECDEKKQLVNSPVIWKKLGIELDRTPFKIK